MDIKDYQEILVQVYNDKIDRLKEGLSQLFERLNLIEDSIDLLELQDEIYELLREKLSTENFIKSLKAKIEKE